MTDETKNKLQQEWTQLVHLTPEQLREIILRKTERGALYSKAIVSSPKYYRQEFMPN